MEGLKMDVEQRLKGAGIDLPLPPKPLGAYIEAFRSGPWLLLSGMLPVIDGKPHFVGKVGRELTTQDGYVAARIACLNGLAAAKEALGSLDRVAHVVKLAVYIAAADGYLEHPKAADGASELLRLAFGEEGLSPRIVLGVASIPLGMAVEVELVLEIRD
ncbi:RidA family protein [Rhizobium sp. NZLR3b]|uniref:RidA family protein n=1 Tax=Rhizobium sp. NZLR3b TaxID=2731101 RepID=UPI001C82E3AD|nr:RidA family protein [Rhizobium sp. NZLR3b]MBX5193501.1 RidA family protein [Rhizobium sp. NZLR3b]